MREHTKVLGETLQFLLSLNVFFAVGHPVLGSPLSAGNGHILEPLDALGERRMCAKEA